MRNFIVVFILCFSLNIFAQNYDFGKVSKEELQEAYNPLDSSAAATYLYKYRRSYFDYNRTEGFELKTEIHERIKIYNKEGFNHATKQIRLYVGNGGDEERVSNIKANTYNLEGEKVVGVKLAKSDIFKSEASKYTNEVKFTMPNIKPGSVVEYKYEINSPFWSNVDDFIFQHDIPIKKMDAIFEVPEYYKFKLNTKGYLKLNPEKEIKRAVLTYKNEVPITENGLMDPNIHYRTGEIEYQKDIFKYSLDSISALKDEPYVNNINNYRASVNYELSYTQLPNSTIKYYSTTWEDVVKTIYRSSDFGGELDRTSYFEADIDALISSVSDPINRIALIFNYVKSKINWNGYYGYYTDNGVKKAYKEKVGNIAEINLMLTSMLKYAGLKAYPVLVSTRQNGVPLFPTREGYNYVVAYVKIRDKGVLLDATNKYSAPNILPYRALNWQGRIIAEGGGSTLIDLYPNEKSENNITMMATLDENGNIEGDYRSLKTNHRALSFREEYIGVDEDDFLEKLENKYGGLEISDYTVKNENDLSEPIQESYKFVKESQADIIGDKLYFSPMFFLSTDENPFKLEKREYPVDFGYPSSVSFRVIINLPEGYKIDSMPEPGVFMMPDNLGLFRYNISGNDKMIQLSVESEMNQSIITPLYYDALKAYFSQLVEKENEQIVLTRI